MARQPGRPPVAQNRRMELRTPSALDDPAAWKASSGSKSTPGAPQRARKVRTDGAETALKAQNRRQELRTPSALDGPAAWKASSGSKSTHGAPDPFSARCPGSLEGLQWLK